MSAAEKQERKHEPNWHAIAVDETYGWDKEFLEKNGITKMRGVYLADFNEVTHCCEITPSYCLWFVESIPEDYGELDDDKRHEMYSDIMQADCHTEPTTYMHCRMVDRMDDEWKVKLEPDLSYAESEQEIIDAVREHYQSCPNF